jgi:hypothetical protein
MERCVPEGITGNAQPPPLSSWGRRRGLALAGERSSVFCELKATHSHYLYLGDDCNLAPGPTLCRQIGLSARFLRGIVAKLYTLTIRNRVAALVVVIALLGLGAVFLTVGLALLAGLAVGGGLLGAGYGLVRRLRGAPSRAVGSIHRSADDLNPMLEVRPERPAIVGPAENANND